MIARSVIWCTTDVRLHIVVVAMVLCPRWMILITNSIAIGIPSIVGVVIVPTTSPPHTHYLSFHMHTFPPQHHNFILWKRTHILINIQTRFFIEHE